MDVEKDWLLSLWSWRGGSGSSVGAAAARVRRSIMQRVARARLRHRACLSLQGNGPQRAWAIQDTGMPSGQALPLKQPQEA